MDRKKAYEQIIASKLEALPLPDMADAIWSRIETQLDIDLPADEGGDSGPDSPSGGNLIGRGGLFVFLAAFVTLFLIYKNNKKPESLSQPGRTTQSVQSPLPTINTNKKTTERRMEEAPLLQNRSVDPPIDSGIDSASNIPVSVALPPVDSVQQVTDIPSPSLPVNDPPQRKNKTRGVSGITDNDYRIVPAKKDSS